MLDRTTSHVTIGNAPDYEIITAVTGLFSRVEICEMWKPGHCERENKEGEQHQEVDRDMKKTRNTGSRSRSPQKDSGFDPQTGAVTASV